MNDTTKKYGLFVVKALMTLVFLGAGFAKLSGQEMMVQVFEQVGVGQWFRYVTGAIEVAGAIGLWLRGFQGWAGALLGATMVGAVLAHVLILGPSAVPALVLAVLAGIVVLSHRDQLPLIGR